MLCPKCKKEMIVVERNDVELDYCIECNGFWFDKNELDILFKKLTGKESPEVFKNLYSIPKLNIKTDIRKCPKCGKNMEKFLTHSIILDRCPNHEGVWFDKDELSKLINYTSSKGEKNAPIEFLGEVFYG